MTKDEYNELADLWQAAPRPDEQREMDRLVRRTPRIARATQWGELILVALLAGTVLTSIVMRLGPATMLTGTILLLLLVWSAWKRHNLGNIALLIDEGDRIAFLNSSIRAKQAELNRSALGLALILPGTLLTMLLGFSLRKEAATGDLFGFLVAVSTTNRGLIALAFLGCALLLLSLSHARVTAELKRLRALQADYAEEARMDSIPGI